MNFYLVLVFALSAFAKNIRNITDGHVTHISKSGVINITWPDGQWNYTMPTGENIVHLADGTLEHVYPNGLVNITYPDGKINTTFPNGTNIVSWPWFDPN